MNLKKILPENIRLMTPYVAGKTVAEVHRRFNPSRISKLASNENRLGCSPLVEPAVLEALKGVHNYPESESKKLRAEIAARNDVPVSEVMVAAGSESLISIIYRTFFKHHEHAITASATFAGFFVQAAVRGVSVRTLPLTKDYTFDVDAILREVAMNTKVVYIANPNNPTGTYIDQETYKKLLDRLPEDVLLINDEAYYEYARSIGDYPRSLDYRKKNVVVLRTFSKAYGLAGLRVGYAIAEKELIQEMMKAKLTFEPSAPAQAAAFAAMKDEAFVNRSVDTVQNGKARLYAFFDRHHVRYVQSAANSVMMVLKDEGEAIQFTREMMKQGVILRRVNAFGLPDCVRITIGTEQDMDHFERTFLKIREHIQF